MLAHCLLCSLWLHLFQAREGGRENGREREKGGGEETEREREVTLSETLLVTHTSDRKGRIWN